MGLFDRLDDLVQDTKDKVTDVTGIDADALLEAADGITEAGEKVAEAAESYRANRAEN